MSDILIKNLERSRDRVLAHLCDNSYYDVVFNSGLDTATLRYLGEACYLLDLYSIGATSSDGKRSINLLYTILHKTNTEFSPEVKHCFKQNGIHLNDALRQAIVLYLQELAPLSPKPFDIDLLFPGPNFKLSERFIYEKGFLYLTSLDSYIRDGLVRSIRTTMHPAQRDIENLYTYLLAVYRLKEAEMFVLTGDSKITHFDKYADTIISTL